jgi:hypothetical protein
MPYFLFSFDAISCKKKPNGKVMKADTFPLGEKYLNLALLLAILAWAIPYTTWARLAPYRDFVKRAEKIQVALEAFARDHGGQYPPDCFGTEPPEGLSPQYLPWAPAWNIDYEVHPNGQGGYYVGLEFRGPHRPGKNLPYLMLTQIQAFRKAYGQGQRIPGKKGRIYIFHESAPILGEETPKTQVP